jgi:hypothetical protein
MKMVAGLILLFSCVLSLEALAARTSKTDLDCPKLVSDLRGMKNAQQAMMHSFVKKNDTIADALDEMAKDQRHLNGLTLKRSARTFRQHEAREAKLVSRFETASTELLNQVEQCLMKETRLSSNK